MENEHSRDDHVNQDADTSKVKLMPQDGEDTQNEATGKSQNNNFDSEPVAKVSLLPKDFKLPDPQQIKREKRRIIKNLAVLTLGFVLLFSSLTGLSMVQSSLNAEIGVFGLLMNFMAVAVSCLLLSTVLLQLLGCKWAIVISMLGIIAWSCANLYPEWSTILPGSTLMGLGWGPLWTGQCTYFTINGIQYAELTDQMPDAVIAKFFGIFFMFFLMSPIIGNIISTVILMQASDETVNAVSDYNVSNITTVISTDPFAFCGAADCNVAPSVNASNDNFSKPPKTLVYTLVGIYVALGLLALTLVALILDKTDNNGDENATKRKTRCSCSPVLRTLKQIGNKYQLLLIPLTTYAGIEQTFMIVEYTKSFVTCALGVDYVGAVVICYGGCAAAMAVASGQLVKLTGRIPVFIIGALFHITALITYLHWRPHPDVLYPFFILAGLWGLGDAIWQTQLNSFYGSMFPEDSEAAFSNYRLWESIGFIMALAYSTFICVYVKIYVCLAVLLLGILGYLNAELLHRKEIGKDKGEEEADEDVATFANLANVARRKSSVFIPEKSVQQAAEVIRRKSVNYMVDEKMPNLLKRKLSTFIPMVAVEEMSHESTPNATPETPRRPSYHVTVIDPKVSFSKNPDECESPRIYRPFSKRKVSGPAALQQQGDRRSPPRGILRSLSADDVIPEDKP